MAIYEKTRDKKFVRIIGAGLAGSEAALQLLKRGYIVELVEMRPNRMTGAHTTSEPAELVCSNSLKSEDPATSSGLLKAEIKELDCQLLKLAEGARVAAGGALAVERTKFSKLVKDELFSYNNFKYTVGEFTDLSEFLRSGEKSNNSESDSSVKNSQSTPTVIATGPLTSPSLSDQIKSLTGDGGFFFFDAVAPIVSAESVDMDCAFYGGRYGKGGDDYLNLYLEKHEYEAFYDALVSAECVKLRDFENAEVFEGCMPIEVMAKRGKDAMRFGPLKPVGLYHPETGKRYYAVVQLRKENVASDAFNLVGFQTNLTFSEQKKVFSMIPALKNAEFLRYGVMHRNSYINAPKILEPTFKVKGERTLYIAGQLSGVEGYVESIASGLIAALNIYAEIEGEENLVLPQTTILGALQRYISTPNDKFQPMNANFALLPFIDVKDKKMRKKEYYNRAMCDIIKFKEKFKL